jgi:hypothetical protein
MGWTISHIWHLVGRDIEETVHQVWKIGIICDIIMATIWDPVGSARNEPDILTHVHIRHLIRFVVRSLMLTVLHDCDHLRSKACCEIFFGVLQVTQLASH